MDAKSKTIKRLCATIERLRDLPDENFKYGKFVSQFSGTCGTVCCVAGWYPHWFPGANLEYYFNTDANQWAIRGNRDLGNSVYFHSIEQNLCTYHFLDTDVIRFLFFGRTANLPYEICLEAMESEYKLIKFHLNPKDGTATVWIQDKLDASREAVIQAFEFIVNYLKFRA